jgi:hypothetical protein
MADESNVLPTSRVVRWVAIGVLIALAVALYFRESRTLPPLTAPAPATASPDQPTN